MSLKHGKQSSCLHGNTTGSISISKQIGQLQSVILRLWTFLLLDSLALSALTTGEEANG